MALPPSIIYNQIKKMPEGEEKEKALKRFQRQMKFAFYAYSAMFIAMGITTVAFLWMLLTK